MDIATFFQNIKKRKNNKIKIFCFGKIFKPSIIVMSIMFAMLLTNLIVKDFFYNLGLSLQNFVESFIKLF